MRNLLFAAAALLSFAVVSGQELYVRTFGKVKDKPLIFLHGGPGYNAASFEATTAKRLAAAGFFVIVYDRRGEGRSVDTGARYTFPESNEDLLGIMEKYKVKKAVLIGHSFGGMVASRFAIAHPEKTDAIILVGAPVSLQATFRNILRKSRKIYENKHDSVNLNYISSIERMDTASLFYSSYCLAHAMQNGFYVPKQLTEEAKELYLKFVTDTILKKYASQMSHLAPAGFWKNEKYTTLDLSAELNGLLDKKVPLFALYGKDDGLYSPDQVEELRRIIGTDHLKYFDNCSHNVFIDQQSKFIEAVEAWTK